MLKTGKKCATAAIAISIVLLLAAAFLYAGYHLAPKTFQKITPEQSRRYRIVMECLFYTGLFGFADGIWRLYRINKRASRPDLQSTEPSMRQTASQLLYYTGIESLLHRMRKPQAENKPKPFKKNIDTHRHNPKTKNSAHPEANHDTPAKDHNNYQKDS